MKKILYSLIVMLVFLLLLFSWQVYAGQEFMPLKVGQTFTFSVTDGVGNSWEEVLAVSGSVSIPSTKKRYFVIDNAPLCGGVPCDEAEFGIVRSTSDKLYQYAGFGVEHLVQQNAPVGTTWSYEHLDGDIIESTVAAIETVTVQAGTFSGCLKLLHLCVNCGDDYWIEWVKPGFGLVKWIDYWTKEPEPVTHELKSWTE